MPVPTNSLIVKHLTKRFGSPAGDIVAVDDVSFEVGPSEFFTMLGPSGCGKTTTLRMVAGLETATGGSIVFGGRDFTATPAQHRNIGMVFQSYALFPHLSVFENVAYGLRLRGLASGKARARVERMLDLLQLRPLAQRHPADLSGGQQQRVSIARALVYDPGMLLLDEPLANLDAKLRVSMREEIRRIQRDLGIMSLYVTHDQEEAMSVSDRLAVFNRGRLMQLGSPAEIFEMPASLFVADFLGQANFLAARSVRLQGGEAMVVLSGGDALPVPRVVTLDATESARLPADCEGLVMVRPNRVRLDPRAGFIPVRATRIQFLGGIVRYTLHGDGAVDDLTADVQRPVPGVVEGGAAALSFAGDDAVVYLRQGSQ
ncbi:MAG: ABC transporter ATP-binding protein [Rhodospirillales bacterium]|nr:ABC transporter ATP-binding protein [Rhodospirillales bacterium]